MNNTEPRDLSDQIGPIPTTTAAQRQAARRVVAAHALDAADARLMLAELGLED